MNLKINLDEGTLCLLVPSTPCPRRNLWLCVSSLTRTLPLGSSSLHSSMGPSSLFIKRTVHYGFALILEDSIRFTKETDIHFHSSLTLRCAMMGMSFTPRSTSDMLPPGQVAVRDEWKTAFQTDMALSVVGKCLKGLPMHLQPLNDLWMTSSQTWLMSQSSSIWMTSSSTPTICLSTRPMFRKYSETPS